MIKKAKASKVIPEDLRNMIDTWKKICAAEDPSIVDDENRNKIRNSFKMMAEYTIIDQLRPYVDPSDLPKLPGDMPKFLFNLIPSVLQILFKNNCSNQTIGILSESDYEKFEEFSSLKYCNEKTKEEEDKMKELEKHLSPYLIEIPFDLYQKANEREIMQCVMDNYKFDKPNND